MQRLHNNNLLLFSVVAFVVIIIMTATSAQVVRAARDCECCCPMISPRLELHSNFNQLYGANLPNFSSSYFTGRHQQVLPSSGLVTVVAEPVLDPSFSSSSSSSSNNAAFQPQPDYFSDLDAAGGNCSWADTTSQRCDLTTCSSNWIINDVAWGLHSVEGIVPDLFSTGATGISATIQVQTGDSFISFKKRMDQSSVVKIGAVYRIPDKNACQNAVHGLPCHQDHFWFLPESGKAWVADISVPLSETAATMVEKTLPSCNGILDKLKLPSSDFANLQAQQQQQQGSSSSSSSLGWLFDSSSSSSNTINRDIALSLENRVLCSHPALDLLSLRRVNRSIVIVVPIVRSTLDTIFFNDADLAACINNHFHPLEDRCTITTPKQTLCSRFQVRIVKDLSLFMKVTDWLGLAVTIVSSLALFFGASAITIAIDAQLLGLLSQSSCAPSVASSATTFLEKFMFLGRAAETNQEKTVAFYASMVGWLIGLVIGTVLGHGLLVVIISVIRRQITRKVQRDQQQREEQKLAAKAMMGSPSSPSSSPTAAASGSGALSLSPSMIATGGQNSVASYTSATSAIAKLNNDAAAAAAAAAAASAAAAGGGEGGGKNSGEGKKKSKKQSGNNNSNNANSSSRPASGEKLSFLEKIFGTIQAEQGTSGAFAMEERRLLARTAAALRFPSASLVVLLVSLQGLWFASLQTWWYSITPVESMPGIVGGLTALLMTLIILVLARQTRLTFTPYSWLHPEQAEADARSQALEVTASVARRSLFILKRSWFFPFGVWGPERPRQRMGTLFLPVKLRSWIGIPFLISLVTCVTVSVYPLTILGCCAQQLFLSMFFFACALIFWKSQPMRAPYANTMFIAVRAMLSVFTFCRTVVLVTGDQVFDSLYFLLIVVLQILILIVGVIDIWAGIAEYFVFLPHLEKRQEIIRARTGGALRMQRQHEEEAFGVEEDDDEDDDNEEEERNEDDDENGIFDDDDEEDEDEDPYSRDADEEMIEMFEKVDL